MKYLLKMNKRKIFVLILMILLLDPIHSFAQQLGGVVKDIEGNRYKTITIGECEWMGENLRATKYNDGSDIPNVTDMTDWVRITTPAFSWYDNDLSNKGSFGALYNWYTVNSGNLCPDGWRVPADADWTILTDFLQATNERGFSALSGGYRYGYYWGSGIFYEKGTNGYWWSATEATDTHVWTRTINAGNAKVYRSFFIKNNGFSVRCIKCNLNKVTDIDGNVYGTVVIGEQEWMLENLKTTRYNNGIAVPNVPDITEWRHIDAPAYVWYENNISNKEFYGALYNYHAVDAGNLCPDGWHVALDDDWKTLEMYMGMTREQADGTVWRGVNEGGKLKEAGTKHWASPNKGATNEVGFTIVPGGRRDSSGKFYDMKTGSTIWTSTQSSLSSACYRHFSSGNAGIGRNPAGDKKFGFAVRCIKE